jgi:hypothetical protein
VESLKLCPMPLPQSCIRSFRVYSFQAPIVVLLLLFSLTSIRAFAAAPQLSCSPASIRFGRVDVGQPETLMVTVTNGGLTSVTISGITVNNSAFATTKLSLPLTLTAGQSVDVNVTFTPATTGWFGANISFSSNSSNALVVQASGTGASSEALTASPSSLSFGQVAVGHSSSLPLTLKNAEPWKVEITAVQTSGNGFSITVPEFPLTLGVGQSISLTATFTPTSAGAVGSSVFVYGPGLAIPLTGTGTSGGAGTLSISPTSLNYGNVAVGTTDTLPVTISATGASVTVSSASSSSSLFALSGASFPLTIAAGKSVSMNVVFTPKSSGSVSGSLSFTSNASDSVATESLTGDGTVTPYSVNLWWNPSSDVVGYNVYRSASSSGSYARINSALDANTAYTDNSVVAGNTYYYAATSVNSSGQESSLSTPPVQAVVP